ncbi:MAG TPA: pentapeptide repeat-containing protein [Candidatus Omnitrophota bacterium]|nr:pentapeptide repeat-containing protein [Candidatus Omnitrophota bacterium]HPS19702.1 pentapeptide repeat-containing protein [Candidatus Omnitrophota bacterium]
MFEEEVYENKEFKGIVLSGEKICRKEFQGCRFENCDFAGCDFSGTAFIDSVFKACNLANIKMDKCGFRGVIFEESKLVGICFTDINPFLLSWEFRNSRIELCNFNGLKMRKSKFSGSTVRETDFVNVDLGESDFSGADLKGTRFHNAVLEKANLKKAENYYIDPMSNKLKGAKFSYPGVLSLLSSLGIKVED